MEITILLTVLQGMAISLGVGCSTLAIINFFVAIADGTIDAGERKMMGVVYTVLRVAMVSILVTTGALYLLNESELSGFALGQITLVGVLFLNAVLMTKRIMSSKFGPAIQAGTWYTLGIITTLGLIGSELNTYTNFVIGYLVLVVLAICLVNFVIAKQKKK